MKPKNYFEFKMLFLHKQGVLHSNPCQPVCFRAWQISCLTSDSSFFLRQRKTDLSDWFNLIELFFFSFPFRFLLIWSDLYCDFWLESRSVLCLYWSWTSWRELLQWLFDSLAWWLGIFWPTVAKSKLEHKQYIYHALGLLINMVLWAVCFYRRISLVVECLLLSPYQLNFGEIKAPSFQFLQIMKQRLAYILKNGLLSEFIGKHIWFHTWSSHRIHYLRRTELKVHLWVTDFS